MSQRLHAAKWAKRGPRGTTGSDPGTSRSTSSDDRREPHKTRTDKRNLRRHGVV